MTPTKGLLLASAAALVVASSAQAADMPVKAKPVQYVRICDVYGAGFYYIPGTETCLRIGGYIRAEYYWDGANGGFPHITGAPGRFTRADTSDYGTRARANIMLDSRTQTQYGTLRTLTSLFFQNQSQSELFQVHRALIQWAGFTFGRSQSFVDIFYLDPYQYVTPFIGTSTDATGVNLVAYTLEFGNGFQLTGSAEERRSRASGRPVTNLSSASALVVGSGAVENADGERFPDLQAVLRYDQAWGNIGVFGVAHDASATYYGGGCPGVQAGTTQCGHPGEQIGWAAGAGGTINLPMFGPGDKIGAQFVYAVGASAYPSNTFGSAGLFSSGNNVAVAWLTDGVYVNGSSVELTTAWSIVAAYEHNWSPSFKTSLYGAYLKVDYNANATAFFSAGCGRTGNGVGVAQGGFSNLSNCNPDFAVWHVGSRSEWSPVRGLTFGADVYWTGIDTAFAGTGTLSGSGIGARPTGVYNIKDLGILTTVFRAQRVF